MESNPRQPYESLEDYTDRLIRERKPGTFRQCSIGWHEECSDPEGFECACDCHKTLFVFTFGVQYASEPHPGTINGVTPHPDGWVVVEAPDENTARRAVHEQIGDKWAFCYPADRFDSSYYQRGELTRIICPDVRTEGQDND